MAFCENCGSFVNESEKLCPDCITTVKPVSDSKTFQMRCKSCNGVMNVDDERKVLICPYCGSKELIAESNEVTIERIRSRTYKEIEFKKLEHEDEKEKRLEEKERNEAFSKSKLSTASLVFAIICGIMTLAGFNSGHLLSGFIALVQTMMFILSLLLGKQIIKLDSTRIANIKLDNHNSAIILAVIGFLLIIPFFLLMRV